MSNVKDFGNKPDVKHLALNSVLFINSSMAGLATAPQQNWVAVLNSINLFVLLNTVKPDYKSSSNHIEIAKNAIANIPEQLLSLTSLITRVDLNSKLISLWPLLVAEGLTFGATKYSAYAWMDFNPVYAIEVYMSAAYRHVNACIIDRKEPDSQSGLLHVSHLLSNLYIVMHFAIIIELMSGGEFSRSYKQYKEILVVIENDKHLKRLTNEKS